MAEATATPNGEAILWRIEAEGVKLSHLLGTAHVTGPRITAGPSGAGDLIAYEHLEIEHLLKRKKVMAERVLPLLEKGHAAIAVGALYLPGEEGLVELLRKAGYKVAPVN